MMTGISYRDPSGFMFRSNGEYFRLINKSYLPTYKKLMKSGLYEALVEKKWFLSHQEVTNSKKVQAKANTVVIKPEQVKFINYPWEWCFGIYQQAALTTLMIQKMAVKRGFSLKDASAYNMQYWRGRCQLIDTLSFEEYIPGKPWIAYRQFCEQFLIPLVLMSRKKLDFGKILLSFPEGVPVKVGAKILDWRDWFKKGVFSHIMMQSWVMGKTGIGGKLENGQLSKSGLLGLIENLEESVSSLSIRSKKSDWLGYYKQIHYSDSAMASKIAMVDKLIEKMSPKSIWDIGSNTGRFSRLGSRRGILTVAMDSDEWAVEESFLRAKKQNDEWLIPLIQDIANPSPAIGWAGEERKSLASRGPADLLLGLAIIHHLVIGRNATMDQVAEWWSRLGRRLIVEFVPLTDHKVRQLLEHKPSMRLRYSQGKFIKAFQKYFEIEWCQRLTDSGRIIYVMKRKRARK